MAITYQKFQVRGPVFLIGFMGSGKSTIAKKLEYFYGLKVIDTDEQVIKNLQKTISEIFNDYGEKGFRDAEQYVITSAAKTKDAVIATGGGCVEIDGIDKDFNKGYVVYLKVSPKVAAQRLKKYKNRPMFKDIESNEELFEKRKQAYEQYADLTIDTDKSSVDEVFTKLVKALEAEEVFCR